MDIRVMGLDDYESVYALWSSTAGMGLRSLDDSYDGIARFLKRNPSTNFVALENDKIIGVILCGHDGRRGYIYHTAVEPICRKRGIGRVLLDKTLEALQKEGINKVALVVFATNESGNAFWEKMGFSERVDLIYRNKSINPDNA